jgi:S-adenosylmethionine decarboxylase proenzyme
MNHPVGTHIIVDLNQIDRKVFESFDLFKFDLHVKHVLSSNSVTLINSMTNDFGSPGAFTSLYLLAESHLSIHTWPENKYVALDVFTCGQANTQKIVDEIIEYFVPLNIQIKTLIRG